MRISNWLAAAASTALVVGAGQAGAVVYTTTYQGTVITGYDNTGIYGPAGGNLTGQAFTAVLQVDTSLGVTTTDYYQSQTIASRPQSIFTSTAVTIGGVTHSLDSLSDPSWSGHTSDTRRNYADFYTVNDPGGPECAPPINACYSEIGNDYDAVAHTDLFDDHGVNIGLTQSNTNLFALADTNLPAPGQPLTGPPITMGPGDITLSDGTFRTYDLTLLFNPGGTQTLTYAYDTYAEFHIDSVTISGAPEPGAWALMILGFGATGATLRRRRKLAIA